MQVIETHIKNFKTISLFEMENVQLLDRMESKFYFSIEELPAILNLMITDYYILDVNGVKVNRYESIYYDTEDFKLYLLNQNRIAKRCKVRYRNYLDSKLSFFEIKEKNNKNRTIKHRILNNDSDCSTDKMIVTNEIEKLIQTTTPYNSKVFQKKLAVYYSRLTFVNKTDCERVTLDLYLNFTNKTESVHYSNIVIAEVKQTKTTLNSIFITIMRRQKINEGGLSKYCFGVATLFPKMKQNLFKEQIKNLLKTTLC